MRKTFAILCVGTLALGIGALTNCTFLTDFSECENDGDCAAEYGARTACVDSICEPAGNITGDPCEITPLDCADVEMLNSDMSEMDGDAGVMPDMPAPEIGAPDAGVPDMAAPDMDPGGDLGTDT